MNARLLAAVLAAALAAGARAQDRPSEDELFGAPAQPAPEKRPAPAPAPPGGASGPHGETEAELFGSQSPPNAPPPPPGALITREREDWLKIGGLLQLQAQASAYDDTPPGDWPFVSPNLLDVYLDTRPNDRVRGFVLGRLSWDPTVQSSPGTQPASPRPGSGGGASAVGLGTAPTTANPGAVLDQLWLNFDAGHRIFVTAGRQHVKWGVGKFWNPTDYLHPVRRNPLATFDTRSGTTMVKVHLPWEKRGWNLYGIALLEDLAGNTSQTNSRLARIGGGGRAEVVLGSAELGLDAMAQEGHLPRYGADLSAGVGDFDVYSEVALRTGGDAPHWIRGETGPAPPGVPASLTGWVADTRTRLTPQVVAGATWAYKYSDEDSLSVGAEYFYNELGYDDRSIYPFLLTGAPAFGADANGNLTAVQQDPAAFQPFYLGKHYAALNLYLPRPGHWNDTSIIVSGIGNLSDKSYVARLDVSVLVLTYMTVETFVAGHFGQKGGEFRLVVPPEFAALAAAQTGSASFPTGAPVVDMGVALRVSL
jgi:hypothetical protein